MTVYWATVITVAPALTIATDVTSTAVKAVNGMKGVTLTVSQRVLCDSIGNDSPSDGGQLVVLGAI